MGLRENGTYRGACWTLWVKMLSQSGAFRKMPYFHLPLRIWLLCWVRCTISLRVRALWCSRMIALLRSFGSRQILNLPLGFFGYINELTHGVGSICFAMMPWRTISFSSVLISALCSIGTLHLPCRMGGTLGSVLMSYSPDMSPIWSKELGYRVCKSLVLLMWTLPGST